jgi:hypothetical protein
MKCPGPTHHLESVTLVKPFTDVITKNSRLERAIDFQSITSRWNTRKLLRSTLRHRGQFGNLHLKATRATHHYRERQWQHGDYQQHSLLGRYRAFRA